MMTGYAALDFFVLITSDATSTLEALGSLLARVCRFQLPG